VWVLTTPPGFAGSYAGASGLNPGANRVEGCLATADSRFGRWSQLALHAGTIRQILHRTFAASRNCFDSDQVPVTMQNGGSGRSLIRTSRYHQVHAGGRRDQTKLRGAARISTGRLCAFSRISRQRRVVP
jgi:hypothetical protein